LRDRQELGDAFSKRFGGLTPELLDNPFSKGGGSNGSATFRTSSSASSIMLDTAAVLEDLRSTPGNRLEPLTGDRAGQHSIRINDQFRVCFRWTSSGPEDVEIVDYH
jgi:proteic killer suppression protein